MVSLSYAVSNQIRLLVSNLNKKSYKTSTTELKDLARLYGDDARLCLLLCLVEEIDFHDPKNQKDHFKITLLLQELGELSSQPNFASIVCRALHSSVLANDFFGSFIKVAKLPFPQALLIALGLVESADKKQKEEGLKFLKAKMQDMTEFNSEQLSEHVLSQLIYFVRETDELPGKQKTSFLTALEQLNPKTFASASLIPVVRDHEPEVSDVNALPNSDSALPLVSSLQSQCRVAAMMQDLGFGVCESTESFKEFLSAFSLTPSNVAEMIMTIIRTKDEQVPHEDAASMLSGVLSGTSSVDASELDANDSKVSESKRNEAHWNTDVFVQTITELYPDMSWLEVFSSFDLPQFILPAARSFNLFLQIFQLASAGAAFPTEILLHPWNNRAGQLSLIRHVLQSPLSILSFPNAQRLLQSETGPAAWLSLDLLEILLTLSDSDISYDVRELIDVMQDRTPELLLSGLLVLSRSCEKGVALLNEVASDLIRTHLDDTAMIQRLWGQHSGPFVNWFVRIYLEQSTEGNPGRILTQILRFTQTTPGALAKVLEAEHAYFCVDLATVASTADQLDLETWLQAQVQERGNSFVATCCELLRDRPVLPPGDIDPRPSVSVQVAAIFFKVFTTNKELLSQPCADEVARLYKLTGSTDPQLYTLIISEEDIEDESRSYFDKVYSHRISVVRMVDLLRTWRDSESKRDRELQACMIYQLFDEFKFFPNYPVKQLKLAGSLWGLLIQHKLVSSYTLVIALRCVLEGLRKPEESKLFKFGMWALAQFKERLPQWPYVCSQIIQIPTLRGSHPELVSFLDQILPQGDQSKEANIEGVNSLIDGDDSSNPASQMNYEARMEAIDHVDPMILPDSNFPTDEPAEKIQVSAEEEDRLIPSILKPSNTTRPAEGSQSQDVQKPLSGPEIAERIASDTVKDRPIGPTSFGSALNIDTLLSVERTGPVPTAPSEAIKDKIHFIINNVSKANLKMKADKLKEILGEELFPYFSRYLVVKRISIEANFQKLYAQFLDVVNVPKLDKQLVETTYEYIKVLLNSEKILTSSSERSLLKNLGSWLGLLTIGKNKPLRANKLNLKELVLQAYESGRLIAVVPFGAKVLEACSTSKVFKPPNPWLMALVSLLKEIFDLPDLGMNLKFEIEVLFNNLSIKIKEVKPSALLNDRIVKRNMHQNFPVQLPPEPGVMPEEPTRLAGRSYPGPQAGTDETQPGNSAEAPSILPAYVTIHPSIALFSMYPHLKRCVPTAIDRAIRDIITPVVERSVTIACVTTRELIMKDFAMEPDENKVRKAAHQMVQKLTSSLAEVTCKEPLRVSINNHLSSLLEANSNSNERTLVDHACTQVSSDNLELGINLIEKAASDRAVREIEESLAPLFLLRSKHREQTGQPYYDVSIFAGNGRFPSALPDALRPKPGGLSSAQLRVYDDFSTPSSIPPAASKPDQKIPGEVVPEFPRQTPPTRTGPEAIPPPTLQPRIPSNPPGLPAPAASGAAPLTSQQTLDKLIGCLASLEQAVSRFANHKNTLLPSLRADHEIIVLLRMIPSILGQCPKDEATFPRDVVAFTFAHKVFKRLYERDNRHSLLQVDVHIQILRCIRQLCPKIVKELTSWLLFSDDERKYLIQITTGLLRARMLHIPEVDLYLAKLVVTVHASGQALQTRNLNPTLHPHLEFVINLVRRTVVKEPILAMQELSHLFDALTKMQTVSQRRNKPVAEVLAHLMESVRLAATANVPVAEDPAATPAAFPPTPSAGASPPVVAREVSQDQRPDIKDVDEATSQLYFEEAAMDRLPWDDDPPNFRQQIVYLLEDWMNICMQGTASDKTYAQYLAVLQQQRVLASADSTSRFFLILTQLCVDRAYASTSFSEDPEAPGAAKAGGTPGMPLNASQQQYATSMTQQAQQPAQLSYTAIDALAKLVVFLVKFFAGEGTSPSNPNAPKIRMLNAFLRSACRVLRRDFDLSGRAVRSGKGTATFNQRPYFRLFANLLHHLNTPDPSLDSNNVEVVAAFGQCFRLLRPSRVPSFCFAWLELISHRMFMSKLLISKSTQCAILFERLLVDLLEFMQPYLRNAELTDSVRLLYKGALRVLLVLLHDFPEFLCDFHFSFCDVIPITCVQMRNLILSAFPRSMRLPDPFTPNLKVDLLPDITQSPRLLSDITSQLNRHRQTLMQPLESYLAKRSPPAFLTQIRQTLLLTAAQAKKTGTKYNVPLINSLVLYVGCQGITKLQAKTGAQFQDNACMDVFEALVTTLDAEGRYYVLNSIANQLRYPNNHTHYFSCVLLYLFLQSKQSVIMEQITRVLLERLIVHRPHPWGLLITFIELIKNPRYSFWKRAFTRCAPEIERLFDSVARSCMPNQKAAPPTNLPSHPGAQPQQHPGLAQPAHHPQQHPQQPQQPPQQQHTYNSAPRPPTM